MCMRATLLISMLYTTHVQRSDMVKLLLNEYLLVQFLRIACSDRQQGLSIFPSTRGKGPRDAISAKLQVIRNLTLKGKENSSKETWLPLLPPWIFQKTKLPLESQQLTRRVVLLPSFKINAADMDT